MAAPHSTMSTPGQYTQHTISFWFINIDPELCLIKWENICPGNKQNNFLSINRSYYGCVVLSPPVFSVVSSFFLAIKVSS